MLELAHVARPRVALEEGGELGVEATHTLAELARVVLGEVAREQQDVAAALAQRRQRERDHVEAVVEVLPERALRDRGLEIPVRGRDEAHVDRVGRTLTQRTRHLVLQHAQQLDLQRRGELRDFVQVQRAAVRLADEPLAAIGAAGAAEELRLQDCGCQRAALDRHEGALRARPAGVQRVREQFLAGAVLAGEEDVGLRQRGLAHALERLLHAGAVAQDGTARVGAAQRAAQRRILAGHAPLLQRTLHRVQQLVVVERLDDVVHGAGAQRRDGALEGRVARHHDDRLRAVALVDEAQGVQPRAIGKLEVGDHEVEVAGREAAQALLHRRRALHVVALAREQELHDLRDTGVVLDDVDPLRARCGHGYARPGRKSSMHAPPSGWLLAASAPPSSWTIS